MRAPILTLTAVFFTCITALGQRSVPVFRSAQDSVDFASIQSRLNATRNLLAANDATERDSLMHVHDMLLTEQIRLQATGILRYRMIYLQDPLLTSYDQFVKEGNAGEKIRTMSITGGKRTELPDSLFLCSNLEELELVNWKLKKLPKRLKELPKLREVSLLNNQPSSPLRLSRNKSIKELNIRGDDGNGRLPRRYSSLRALETLDVSRNGLTTFPNISGCRKLTKLSATFNEITLDQLRARHVTQLAEVNLSNNKIKRVPESIGDFTQVKKLNFNNNQIEDVSKGIASLKQLEEVSFYKNRLKAIPEPVYDLPKLKVIDLYFNEIEVTDARLGNMQSLEILYLANNLIYTLPDNLGHLSRLRELYLHNNRLSNLPRSLGNLPDLAVLRVNNNSLLEFPPFLFELQKLQNLDVSHNQMTSLPVNDFFFKDLKILALVGNPWDKPTKQELPALANRLRQNYKTVVHLNTYEDQIE